MDIYSHRVYIESQRTKEDRQIASSLLRCWKSVGLPDFLQMDNELSFHGSNKYPRSFGMVIKLCLHFGVQPVFIPVSEPWRNGVVEKFNEHYRQRFLRKIAMDTEKDLRAQSLVFEQRHNSSYRYSKLGGKTPLKALSASAQSLRFPDKERAPEHPMEKPVTGRYHVVRFIRGNLKLDIFGELFQVSPDLQYEYVIATIDVKEQKLKIYLNKTQVDEFTYKLR